MAEANDESIIGKFCKVFAANHDTVTCQTNFPISQ